MWKSICLASVVWLLVGQVWGANAQNQCEDAEILEMHMAEIIDGGFVQMPTCRGSSRVCQIEVRKLRTTLESALNQFGPSMILMMKSFDETCDTQLLAAHQEFESTTETGLRNLARKYPPQDVFVPVAGRETE